MTLAKRKNMAAMQRRIRPNAVGLWDLLQPWAYALNIFVE